MTARDLLMPKGTAIWLIRNTAVTFKQIADFTGFHVLEIESFAENANAQGFDPIHSHQLTPEEIQRCEQDPEASLQMAPFITVTRKKKTTARKYTPISKRGDKPKAALWILKYYPHFPEVKICRLISTTKKTLSSVRDKTHWDYKNLKPVSPVELGLCSRSELNQLIEAFAHQATSTAEKNHQILQDYFSKSDDDHDR